MQPLGCHHEMTNKDRVTQLISTRDWEGLTQMLGSLSNMELRRMEHVMREEVLPTLENGLFWETLLCAVKFKRAAFISGVTAVSYLVKEDTLDFEVEGVERLYEHLKATNPESLLKICNMMVPELRKEAQVMQMFEAFHVENEVTRISVLLKSEHDLSYYLIFKTLKLIEDRLIARKCCVALMIRQDDRAFNAVCLIKAYFGLDDLPARFSLTIEQYELSHIDRDYDTFCHVLDGKRPKV